MPEGAVPEGCAGERRPSSEAVRAPPPRRLTALAPFSARVSASSGETLFPAPSARSEGSGPESSGSVPPSAMAASETAPAAAKAKRRPRQGERSASRATSCMRKTEPPGPPGSTAVEPCAAGTYPKPSSGEGAGSAWAAEPVGRGPGKNSSAKGPPPPNGAPEPGPSPPGPPGRPWRRARNPSEGDGEADMAKALFRRRWASASALHLAQVARWARTRSRASCFSSPSTSAASRSPRCASAGVGPVGPVPLTPARPPPPGSRPPGSAARRGPRANGA